MSKLRRSSPGAPGPAGPDDQAGAGGGEAETGAERNKRERKDARAAEKKRKRQEKLAAKERKLQEKLAAKERKRRLNQAGNQVPGGD
jgi:hypothetical protein